MNFKRISNRKSILWLVVIAVLMRTLMPAVAHSGARKFASDLVEICTATGVQSVVADQANTPALPVKNHHGEHCPYCFVADGAALPPSASTANFLAITAGTYDFAVSSTNMKTAAILAAPPRGPPARRT